MSAQQLADECVRLGHQGLQRTVISNLENGRRQDISMADVLVLAAALEVPPAALVFPVGYAPEVEYLPGRTADPLQAAGWFAGEEAAEDSALALVRRHRDLERRIRGVYRRMWEQGIAEQRYEVELEDAEAEAGRVMARELTEQLHELREVMAAAGLVLPPLPAGLDRPTGT